jgi:hypothetical protein
MPVGSVYRSGLFQAYAYKLRDCGLKIEPATGSGLVNLPCGDEKYLAPK